jgi:L-threonylcarbamoyladenylate synthase
MSIWPISAIAPNLKVIQDAVGVLRNGAVIAFPTSTLYGLGADAKNPEAIRRIFTIKSRSPKQAILILIQDKSWLKPLVKEIPPVAEVLMDAFWPGGITMIFQSSQNILPDLMGDTGKIGIRVPKHPVAAAIVSELKGPLTGTSANLSGRPGCADITSLDAEVAAQVDGVLDAGPLKGGRGSTVIDVTQDPPQILRDGTISKEQIESLLRSST